MSPEQGQRVAIYIRCSTNEQAREGLSLPVQETKCRAWAEAHDLDVVHVIQDAGQSGKSLRRPGMVELLDKVRAGEVDAVLVHKLDRLTRSVGDFGTILGELESTGCSLASVRDSLDTSSAAGRLVVHIMLSVSQWEREIIAERTVDALALARDKGTYLGQPPVGYKVCGGKLVPTDRIDVVKRAHELRSEGLTMRAIAADLEHSGFRTGSGLTRWHPPQVRRLLASPLPAG